LTDDIPRRLEQHNKGKCLSTRSYRPFKLVHVEICRNRSDARKVEKFFKSGYGRETIKEIINNY